MNQEIKAKWVAALRSGDYKQTTGELRSGDEDSHGYCCLGVLCEISKLETGFGITENLNENHGDDLICETVQEWAGLNQPHGASVNIRGDAALLTYHNDTNGTTFLEIADAIEEQL